MACFVLLTLLLTMGKGELQMLRVFFSLQYEEEEEGNKKCVFLKTLLT